MRVVWLSVRRLVCAFSLVLLLLAVLPAVATAGLVTVAYDGFDYAAGDLTGRNGGTGWTSSWIHGYGDGTSFNVSTTGLTYTGLSTSGGQITWKSGGNGIDENRRSLQRQDSGVTYLQFLSKFGSSSGGGTPNVRLWNSGTQTGGIGGNGGTYGGVMSILDASLNAKGDGSSSSSVSLATLSLVVVRIDYDTVATTMWVNPTLSTFDYDAPTDPDATYLGLAPQFDSIRIYSRSPANFDELQVMSLTASAVPEPSTLGLAVVGVCGWCGWRRRRAVRALASSGKSSLAEGV